MTAWYNEPDPFAAAWLRNLIAAGHIAPGVVDERDIREIEAFEIARFTQCHFFAGIGVWSHALRRAGWSDDRPIWTGSCPCQPFSAAGKQKGFDDDRHLWPYWFDLIAECRPGVVVGEQVASALSWLDLVQTDMENTGYAFGASDLCAAGFGGAHTRQRLYFVGLADTDDARPQGRGLRRDRANQRTVGQAGVVVGLADTERDGQHGCREIGPGGRSEPADSSSSRNTVAGRSDAPLLGRTPVDWLFCRDGKWRPVGPGTFPLVDKTTSRVGRLRAYGNALDAETATEFLSAVMDITS